MQRHLRRPRLRLRALRRLGRYRVTNNGFPVDASGTVPDLDLGGPFVDAVEPSLRLADNELALRCASKQLLRFGYGRIEGPADQCTIDQLADDFIAADGDFRSLLKALTTTKAFLYRRVGGDS